LRSILPMGFVPDDCAVSTSLPPLPQLALPAINISFDVLFFGIMSPIDILDNFGFPFFFLDDLLLPPPT